MKFSFSRFLSASIAVFYFTANCVFAHALETNFWKERADSAKSQNEPIQVAGLPLLPPTVPQTFTSAISQQIENQIPKSSRSQYFPLLKALPSRFGSIRNVSFPSGPSTGKTIIHIQDVHLNPEAQQNIGKTVEELVGQKKIDLVALEGAFARIDLAPFRSFEDKRAVQIVGDYLLRENRISGAVHAAFVSSNDVPPIIGVDEKLHYDANVDAYRQSSLLAEKAKKQLAEAQDKLSKKETSTFNPALAAFHQQVKDYREGKLSMGEYVEALSATHSSSPREGPSTHAQDGERKSNQRGQERGSVTDGPSSLQRNELPVLAPPLSPPLTGRGKNREGTGVSLNVETFLSAYHMERELNFAQVESERTILLTELLKKLSKTQSTELLNTSIAYRLGNIRHADFYEYLKNLCSKNGISLSRYKAMDSYIQYILLSDAINSEKLISEIAEMENASYASLTKTDNEKILIAESKRLYLVGKLLDFALTPDEWNQYKNFKAVTPAKAGAQVVNLLLGKVQNLDPGFRREDGLATFEDFYKQAEIRNHAITENLLKAMDQNHATVAVLVTGGFHSPGIDQLLKDAGVATITYVPKITQVDSENGSSYLSVFAQEKTPLDKLFAGEKLFLAINPAQLPPTVIKTELGQSKINLRTGESVEESSIPQGRIITHFRPDHQIDKVKFVATIGFGFGAAVMVFHLAGRQSVLVGSVIWLFTAVFLSHGKLSEFSFVRLATLDGRIFKFSPFDELRVFMTNAEHEGGQESTGFTKEKIVEELDILQKLANKFVDQIQSLRARLTGSERLALYQELEKLSATTVAKAVEPTAVGYFEERGIETIGQLINKIVYVGYGGLSNRVCKQLYEFLRSRLPDHIPSEIGSVSVSKLNLSTRSANILNNGFGKTVQQALTRMLRGHSFRGEGSKSDLEIACKILNFIKSYSDLQGRSWSSQEPVIVINAAPENESANVALSKPLEILGLSEEERVILSLTWLGGTSLVTVGDFFNNRSGLFGGFRENPLIFSALRKLDVYLDENKISPIKVKLEREELDRSLHEFAISSRVANAYDNYGIGTIGDLLQNSPKKLFKMENYGKKSLAGTIQIVEEELRLHHPGLRIRLDFPNTRLIECIVIDSTYSPAKQENDLHGRSWSNQGTLPPFEKIRGRIMQEMDSEHASHIFGHALGDRVTLGRQQASQKIHPLLFSQNIYEALARVASRLPTGVRSTLQKNVFSSIHNEGLKFMLVEAGSLNGNNMGRYVDPRDGRPVIAIDYAFYIYTLSLLIPQKHRSAAARVFVERLLHEMAHLNLPDVTDRKEEIKEELYVLENVDWVIWESLYSHNAAIDAFLDHRRDAGTKDHVKAGWKYREFIEIKKELDRRFPPGSFGRTDRDRNDLLHKRLKGLAEQVVGKKNEFNGRAWGAPATSANRNPPASLRNIRRIVSLLMVVGATLLATVRGQAQTDFVSFLKQNESLLLNWGFQKNSTNSSISLVRTNTKPTGETENFSATQSGSNMEFQTKLRSVTGDLLQSQWLFLGPTNAIARLIDAGQETSWTNNAPTSLMGLFVTHVSMWDFLFPDLGENTFQLLLPKNFLKGTTNALTEKFWQGKFTVYGESGRNGIFDHQSANELFYPTWAPGDNGYLLAPVPELGDGDVMLGTSKRTGSMEETDQITSEFLFDVYRGLVFRISDQKRFNPWQNPDEWAGAMLHILLTYVDPAERLANSDGAHQLVDAVRNQIGQLLSLYVKWYIEPVSVPGSLDHYTVNKHGAYFGTIIFQSTKNNLTQSLLWDYYTNNISLFDPTGKSVTLTPAVITSLLQDIDQALSLFDQAGKTNVEVDLKKLRTRLVELSSPKDRQGTNAAPAEKSTSKNPSKPNTSKIEGKTAGLLGAATFLSGKKSPLKNFLIAGVFAAVTGGASSVFAGQTMTNAAPSALPHADANFFNVALRSFQHLSPTSQLMIEVVIIALFVGLAAGGILLAMMRKRNQGHQDDLEQLEQLLGELGEHERQEAMRHYKPMSPETVAHILTEARRQNPTQAQELSHRIAKPRPWWKFWSMMGIISFAGTIAMHASEVIKPAINAGAQTASPWPIQIIVAALFAAPFILWFILPLLFPHRFKNKNSLSADGIKSLHETFVDSVDLPEFGKPDNLSQLNQPGGQRWLKKWIQAVEQGLVQANVLYVDGTPQITLSDDTLISFDRTTKVLAITPRGGETQYSKIERIVFTLPQRRLTRSGWFGSFLLALFIGAHGVNAQMTKKTAPATNAPAVQVVRTNAFEGTWNDWLKQFGITVGSLNESNKFTIDFRPSSQGLRLRGLDSQFRDFENFRANPYSLTLLTLWKKALTSKLGTSGDNAYLVFEGTWKDWLDQFEIPTQAVGSPLRFRVSVEGRRNLKVSGPESVLKEVQKFQSGSLTKTLYYRWMDSVSQTTQAPASPTNSIPANPSQGTNAAPAEKSAPKTSPKLNTSTTEGKTTGLLGAATTTTSTRRTFLKLPAYLTLGGLAMAAGVSSLFAGQSLTNNLEILSIPTNSSIPLAYSNLLEKTVVMTTHPVSHAMPLWAKGAIVLIALALIGWVAWRVYLRKLENRLRKNLAEKFLRDIQIWDRNAETLPSHLKGQLRSEDFQTAMKSWEQAAVILEMPRQPKERVARALQEEREAFSEISGNDRLPIEGTSTPEDEAKWAALGIQLSENIPGTPTLFRKATLPTGWKIIQHPGDVYRSDLVDDQGKVRAGIFYKKTPFDRRASISIHTPAGSHENSQGTNFSTLALTSLLASVLLTGCSAPSNIVGFLSIPLVLLGGGLYWLSRKVRSNQQTTNPAQEDLQAKIQEKEVKIRSLEADLARTKEQSARLKGNPNVIDDSSLWIPKIEDDLRREREELEQLKGKLKSGPTSDSTNFSTLARALASMGLDLSTNSSRPSSSGKEGTIVIDKWDILAPGETPGAKIIRPTVIKTVAALGTVLFATFSSMAGSLADANLVNVALRALTQTNQVVAVAVETVSHAMPMSTKILMGIGDGLILLGTFVYVFQRSKNKNLPPTPANHLELMTQSGVHWLRKWMDSVQDSSIPKDEFGWVRITLSDGSLVEFHPASNQLELWPYGEKRTRYQMVAGELSVDRNYIDHLATLKHIVDTHALSPELRKEPGSNEISRGSNFSTLALTSLLATVVLTGCSAGGAGMSSSDIGSVVITLLIVSILAAAAWKLLLKKNLPDAGDIFDFFRRPPPGSAGGAMAVAGSGTSVTISQEEKPTQENSLRKRLIAFLLETNTVNPKKVFDSETLSKIKKAVAWLKKDSKSEYKNIQNLLNQTTIRDSDTHHLRAEFAIGKLARVLLELDPDISQGITKIFRILSTQSEDEINALRKLMGVSIPSQLGAGGLGTLVPSWFHRPAQNVRPLFRPSWGFALVLLMLGLGGSSSLASSADANLVNVAFRALTQTNQVAAVAAETAKHAIPDSPKILFVGGLIVLVGVLTALQILFEPVFGETRMQSASNRLDKLLNRLIPGRVRRLLVQTIKSGMALNEFDPKSLLKSVPESSMHDSQDVVQFWDEQTEDVSSRIRNLRAEKIIPVMIEPLGISHRLLWKFSATPRQPLAVSNIMRVADAQSAVEVLNPMRGVVRGANIVITGRTFEPDEVREFRRQFPDVVFLQVINTREGYGLYNGDESDGFVLRGNNSSQLSQATKFIRSKRPNAIILVQRQNGDGSTTLELENKNIMGVDSGLKKLGAFLLVTGLGIAASMAGPNDSASTHFLSDVLASLTHAQSLLSQILSNWPLLIFLAVLIFVPLYAFNRYKKNKSLSAIDAMEKFAARRSDIDYVVNDDWILILKMSNGAKRDELKRQINKLIGLEISFPDIQKMIEVPGVSIGRPIIRGSAPSYYHGIKRALFVETPGLILVARRADLTLPEQRMRFSEQALQIEPAQSTAFSNDPNLFFRLWKFNQGESALSHSQVLEGKDYFVKRVNGKLSQFIIPLGPNGHRLIFNLSVNPMLVLIKPRESGVIPNLEANIEKTLKQIVALAALPADHVFRVFEENVRSKGNPTSGNSTVLQQDPEAIFQTLTDGDEVFEKPYPLNNLAARLRLELARLPATKLRHPDQVRVIQTVPHSKIDQFLIDRRPVYVNVRDFVGHHLGALAYAMVRASGLNDDPKGVLLALTEHGFRLNYPNHSLAINFVGKERTGTFANSSSLIRLGGHQESLYDLERMTLIVFSILALTNAYQKNHQLENWGELLELYASGGNIFLDEKHGDVPSVNVTTPGLPILGKGPEGNQPDPSLEPAVKDSSKGQWWTLYPKKDSTSDRLVLSLRDPGFFGKKAAEACQNFSRSTLKNLFGQALGKVLGKQFDGISNEEGLSILRFGDGTEIRVRYSQNFIHVRVWGASYREAERMVDDLVALLSIFQEYKPEQIKNLLERLMGGSISWENFLARRFTVHRSNNATVGNSHTRTLQLGHEGPAMRWSGRGMDPQQHHVVRQAISGRNLSVTYLPGDPSYNKFDPDGELAMLDITIEIVPNLLANIIARAQLLTSRDQVGFEVPVDLVCYPDPKTKTIHFDFDQAIIASKMSPAWWGMWAHHEAMHFLHPEWSEAKVQKVAPLPPREELAIGENREGAGTKSADPKELETIPASRIPFSRGARQLLERVNITGPFNEILNKTGADFVGKINAPKFLFEILEMRDRLYRHDEQREQISLPDAIGQETLSGLDPSPVIGRLTDKLTIRALLEMSPKDLYLKHGVGYFGYHGLISNLSSYLRIHVDHRLPDHDGISVLLERPLNESYGLVLSAKPASMTKSNAIQKGVVGLGAVFISYVVSAKDNLSSALVERAAAPHGLFGIRALDWGVMVIVTCVVIILFWMFHDYSKPGPYIWVGNKSKDPIDAALDAFEETIIVLEKGESPKENSESARANHEAFAFHEQLSSAQHKRWEALSKREVDARAKSGNILKARTRSPGKFYTIAGLFTFLAAFSAGAQAITGAMQTNAPTFTPEGLHALAIFGVWVLAWAGFMALTWQSSTTNGNSKLDSNSGQNIIRARPWYRNPLWITVLLSVVGAGSLQAMSTAGAQMVTNIPTVIPKVVSASLRASSLHHFDVGFLLAIVVLIIFSVAISMVVRRPQLGDLVATAKKKLDAFKGTELENKAAAFLEKFIAKKPSTGVIENLVTILGILRVAHEKEHLTESQVYQASLMAMMASQIVGARREEIKRVRLQRSILERELAAKKLPMPEYLNREFDRITALFLSPFLANQRIPSMDDEVSGLAQLISGVGRVLRNLRKDFVAYVQKEHEKSYSGRGFSQRKRPDQPMVKLGIKSNEDDSTHLTRNHLDLFGKKIKALNLRKISVDDMMRLLPKEPATTRFKEALLSFAELKGNVPTDTLEKIAVEHGLDKSEKVVFRYAKDRISFDVNPTSNQDPKGSKRGFRMWRTKKVLGVAIAGILGAGSLQAAPLGIQNLQAVTQPMLAAITPYQLIVLAPIVLGLGFMIFVNTRSGNSRQRSSGLMIFIFTAMLASLSLIVGIPTTSYLSEISQRPTVSSQVEDRVSKFITLLDKDGQNKYSASRLNIPMTLSENESSLWKVTAHLATPLERPVFEVWLTFTDSTNPNSQLSQFPLKAFIRPPEAPGGKWMMMTQGDSLNTDGSINWGGASSREINVDQSSDGTYSFNFVQNFIPPFLQRWTKVSGSSFWLGSVAIIAHPEGEATRRKMTHATVEIPITSAKSVIRPNSEGQPRKKSEGMATNGTAAFPNDDSPDLEKLSQSIGQALLHDGQGELTGDDIRAFSESGALGVEGGIIKGLRMLSDDQKNFVSYRVTQIVDGAQGQHVGNKSYSLGLPALGTVNFDAAFKNVEDALKHPGHKVIVYYQPGEYESLSETFKDHLSQITWELSPVTDPDNVVSLVNALGKKKNGLQLLGQSIFVNSNGDPSQLRGIEPNYWKFIQVVTLDELLNGQPPPVSLELLMAVSELVRKNA